VNHSMISSAVTMHSLQQKLDIIANNMANVDTVGYKRKEGTFEDILNNIKQQPKGFEKQGRLTPLGYVQGWGAKLSQVQFDLHQGTLNPTGNPSDLAIEGGGMFELIRNTVDANGNPVAESVYTRDGSFEQAVIPQDKANTYLATKDGYLVKGVDGNPIKVPVGYKMVVDSQGNVSALNPNKPESGAARIGQLKLVRIVRPEYLKEIGNNLYTVPADLNVGGSIVTNVDPAFLLAEKIAVRQGFLEQSNVNMGDEMSELMMVQRAFQMSSRALTSADAMMNMAYNLRG
jgi:flagellar basal-body rod protein FlgG